MAYIFDEHKGKQDFETMIKPKLDALKTTFQDNVNSMYNALVGKGKTPTAKTPAAISTAITNIFDDVYTKFVNQGTTPSAKTVSGMSSAVDALATAKYNAGNTAGYNSGVAATKKGNAGAGDVLSGKTFTNSSSVNAAGTMANKGAWNGSVAVGGSVTIPAGYHNGSGKVTAATLNKAISNQNSTKKGDILIAFSRGNNFSNVHNLTLITSAYAYGATDTVPVRVYLVNADGGGLSGWDSIIRVYS